MRRFVVATLAASALVGSPIVRAGEESASVVGLWLGEARTEGGLGNWIAFRPDGTAEYSFGALIDGTYRTEGHSLWLTLVGQSESPTPLDMRVELDTAVRRQPPPADAPARDTLPPDERAMFDRMMRPLEMKRVGRGTPGVAAIVGTWTYTHPTGATAYETFTSSGKMFLLVPMSRTPGTYTVAAGGVVLKLPNSEQTLVPHEDVLVSGSLDGKHSTFRRAPK